MAYGRYAPLVRICKGDLILKVGQNPSKDLLVSSHTLRSASKVFDRLLDGRFAEAQALKRSVISKPSIVCLTDGSATPCHKPTLCLPDDDAVAMNTVCNILHLQFDDLPKPESFNITSIAALARVVDKYDLGAKTEFKTKEWLGGVVASLPSLPTTAVPDDMMLLLTAAYTMNDATAFRAASQRILLHHASNAWSFEGDPDYRRLPNFVLRSLDEAVTKAHSDFDRLFAETAIAPSGHRCTKYGTPHSCVHYTLTRGLVIEHLHTQGVYPFSVSTTLNSVLLALASVARERTMVPYHLLCRIADCRIYGNDFPNHMAQLLINKVLAAVPGLCLNCILRDEDKRTLCSIHQPVVVLD